MNERLDKEVREFLGRGKNPEQIRRALEVNGWLDSEIDEALADVLGADAPHSTAKPGQVTPEPQPEDAPIESFSMPKNPEPKAPPMPEPAPETEIVRPMMLPKRPALIIGGLVLLLTVGTAWYFWNNSPSRIADRIYDRMLNVKTVQYVSESLITLDSGDAAPPAGETTPGGEPTPSEAFLGIPKTRAATPDPSLPASEPATITLKAEGAVDARDQKNIGGDLRLSADAKLGRDSFKIAAEGTVKDQVAYGRLTELPANEFFPGVEVLKNIWVKFDVKEAEGKSDVSGPKLDLSQDKMEQVKKILSKYDPVKVTKRFKTEKIDGIDNRHFEYELDKEKLKLAIPEVYKVVTSEDLTKEELEETNRGIDELQTTKAEMWIGKSDNLVHRVRSESTSDSLLGKMKVSTAMNFRDYDKPVDIKVPDGAITAEQLDKETRTDSDKDGLTDVLERYFGSNSKKPDTDGDKFRDGAEILGGYDPTNTSKLTGEKKAFAERNRQMIRSGTSIFGPSQ